ncbi:hypothetical protein FHS18_001304 [Paenibacillus phyllosphaerae]|uniref:Uncharacterized protein n=1 Tax=Paenibacillus phyllosphaerae TaxID=274593 RepID=A0A7W5AV59_9BACL|nr:hypothetical protein [Paenibacillus phyllosphaerae]MBB3109252.1 hypothetical protein [Paenibacillus phyllosphaerae]
MRLTGFIMGTVAGMMTAAYLSKKRPGMVAWAGAATGDMLSSVKGKAISAVMNRKFGRETNAATAAAPTSTAVKTAGSSTNSTDSWNQIEVLMNADPQVKAEAEEIVKENQTH